MPSADALREVVKRLEAGETGRGVDFYIHAAIVNPRTLLDPGSVRDRREPMWGVAADLLPVDNPADLADYITAPAYTTSIAAAATLVPKGCGWNLTSEGHCEIGNNDTWSPKGVASIEGKPAVALCLAVLRARIAMEGE